VSAEELEERAKAEGIMSIETSAKDGFNVKLLFRRLATALPSLDGPPAAADPQASPFAAVLSPAGDDSRARVGTEDPPAQ
jgi:hypothetical protein